jgi:hypothetical protein
MQVLENALKWKNTHINLKYPIDEAKWLISNTWNLGVSSHTNGQSESAKNWIEKAIKLQDTLVPGEFPSQRQMMQGALDKLN